MQEYLAHYNNVEVPVKLHKRRVSAKQDDRSPITAQQQNMTLAQVLRGIIVFIAVFSLAVVSAEEEKLESDEEFDVKNNGEEVEEDEKPSFDNEMELQEG